MSASIVLGAHMRREIFEQPDVVARVLEREWGAASRLGRELRRRDVRFAVLAARGTSDHAATLGKYLFGCELGVPAALAAPSIVTLYQRPLRLKGAAVFGVSQSGRSPDIVEFVRQAGRGGAITIAITNDPGSPLARAARHCLLLHAGPEISVAATKTFTAELACLYLLAAGWLGGERGADLLRDIGRVPAMLRDAFGLEERIAAEAAKGRCVERCVVVSRGFAYPVALEIALKLKEAAGVFAEGASAADFLHGPIGMARRQAGDRFRALLLLSRGPGLHMMRTVERRLAHAGVSLLRLGPPDAPDRLSPFPLAAWGQLAALHLALQKGRDPDRPDGLRKITRTR
ncbi:MAG: SIS domain-containing protein [Elusimicrobia bacterium]|nr:SIS domain-containing protein [Elusimicrobiota bacterium]